MDFKLTRRSFMLATAATVILPVAGVRAQAAWPSRAITLVHGFGPGGNSDGIARVAGEAIAAATGQSVVVDPRPGAGGTTASDQIARAEADGYTLVMFTGAHAVAAAIYKALPYDTVEDFDYISLVAGNTPFTIATYPDSPVNTIQDLIDQAKGGKNFTYATSGIGTTLHLAMEYLASEAGIKMTHIPYTENAQSMVDLLSKRIDFVINGPASVFPQIQAGEIKPIAVTSPERYADLPDVPAIAETLPGFDVTSYYGIAAPKGVPAEVITAVQEALAAGVLEQANIDRVKGFGSTAMSSTPQEFHDRVAADVQKWSGVVAAAGIQQI